jgi:hypothetical protein
MTSLFLAAVVFAALPGAGDPDQFPLALQKSMELDDIDREIQRVRDTAVLKRAQLAASQRLAQKGLVSRSEIERESAELRYQEAKEQELAASRAFKLYEREVKGLAIPPDERKAYSLLLDWVRKQLVIAQIDAEFQASQLKTSRALLKRGAVPKQEVEDAELSSNTSQANVNLGKSREAQIRMELAARSGEKRFDPEEVHRLKTEYLQARVRYFEITAEAARRRAQLARERSRLGLIPANDVATFDRASAEADLALEAEKKALERHQAESPTPKKRSA